MQLRSFFWLAFAAPLSIYACGNSTFTAAPESDGGSPDASADGSATDASADSSVPDAESIDGSSGDAGLAIVTGQNNPNELVVSNGRLFWTNYGETAASSVASARVDGSGIVKLADATHANRITTDGTHVYWSDIVSPNENVSIVGSVLVDGGSSQPVDTGAVAPMGVASDDDNIYVAEYFGAGPGAGSIVAYPKDGGTDFSLASHLDNPVSIVVDTIGYAFTENGTSVGTGSAQFGVWGVGIEGNMLNLASPWGITITDTNAYFANSGDLSGANGSIQSAARNISATGGPTIENSSSRPYFITHDATSVFWTEEGDGLSDGSIGYLVITSSGAVPQKLLSGLKKPHGIAVDASYVYWTSYSTGVIYRAPKP